MQDSGSPKKPIVLLIHGTFANLPDEDVVVKVRSEGSSFWQRLKKVFGGGEEIVEVETSDEGEDWWQVGSPFWTQMKERLAQDGLTLAGDEEVWKQDPENLDEDGNLKEHLRTFKWSSENTERARHKAGKRLFERILEYEREGREYHLIGHSHGGSTVWIALQQSILRRWRTAKDQTLTKLPHLKSWATVATPFLHYRGTRIGSWYGKVATVLMLVISIFMAGLIGVRKIESWSDKDNPLGALLQKIEEGRQAKIQATMESDRPNFPLIKTNQVQPQQQQQQQMIQKAPVLPPMKQQAGVPEAPATLKESISKIGFKDVSAAVFEVLFALMLLVAPFLTVYLWARAARTEARNVYRETRAQNQAMLEFGNRWLGIFSTEDEAINGLRATTYLSGTSIVPKIEIPSETVFDSDRLIRFYRFFIRVFIAPFYNLIFGPAADNYLIAKVAKGAQGHNRMGCNLVDVTEGPILVEGYRYPPLPKEVNQDIIDQANEAIGLRSKEILVKTRTGISQFAWGGSDLTAVVHDVADDLQGDELVHTSYFNHPFVGEVLSLHARDSVEESQPLLLEEAAEEELTWKQKARKVFKAICWVGLGFTLATFSIIESIAQESNRPIFLLSALLCGTGISVVVTSFRKYEVKPPMWSVIAGRIMGGVMIFVALAYGVFRNLFDQITLLGPVVNDFLQSDSSFAHPGLLFSIFISLAATFFAVGLSYFRSNPQWSRTSEFTAFALVVASVWMADAATNTEWGPTVSSAVIVSILVGLYRAFSPLKHAEDVFCPFEIEKEATIEKELFLEVEPEPRSWLRALKEDIRSNLGKQEGVQSYALPLLDEKNRMATVTAWLLIGGILSMVVGLAAENFFLMLAGIAVVPFAWLLSFRPALKATRGALKGGLALLNLNLMSFAFITGIVSLFTWFIYDEFIRIPEAENFDNLATFVSSEDGKPRLAIADRGSIMIWNPENPNQLERVFESSQEDQLWGFVELSPDHRTLAQVDGTRIKIWDLDLENAISKFEVETNGDISCVGFREDGRRLVTGGMDGNLFLWNVVTGKEIAGPFQLNRPIRAMAIHPTKDRVAVGLDGGIVAIWDLESRVEIAAAKLHASDVTDLEYWGEKILSLDRRGNLKFSERLEDGSGALVEVELPTAFKDREKGLSATLMATSSQSKTLAVGFVDKDKRHYLHFSSPGSKGGTWVDLNEGEQPISFDLLPGRNDFIVRSAQGSIELRSRMDGEVLGALGTLSPSVNMVAFANDGATVISGVSDGTVRFRSTLTGEETRQLKGTLAPALSVDRQALAIFDEVGNVDLWSLETGDKLDTLTDFRERILGTNQQILAINSFSAGGLYATASEVGEGVLIREVSNANEVQHLKGIDAPVSTAAFNESGTMLAIATDDGAIGLWDVSTGRLLHTLNEQYAYASRIAFSPDGTMLAILQEDSSLVLWNASTGQQLRRLEDHAGNINAMEFSPDSTTLATTSYDGNTFLWDTATGGIRSQLSEHHTWTADIAFSSDGNLIATALGDGSVRISDAKSGSLIRTLHQFEFQKPTVPATSEP